MPYREHAHAYPKPQLTYMWQSRGHNLYHNCKKMWWKTSSGRQERHILKTHFWLLYPSSESQHTGRRSGDRQRTYGSSITRKNSDCAAPEAVETGIGWKLVGTANPALQISSVALRLQNVSMCTTECEQVSSSYRSSHPRSVRLTTMLLRSEDPAELKDIMRMT